MNNMYDEMSKFSMADDSDDYDEYEEEVIERDEEYDDEDYDDEEEYDDEEYDDEDYDDEEEYDDEEYDDEDYDDEEYDEGYDSQYYDDRLNQVLDELAELKRGMSSTPAVQQQPQMFSPIQPHLLFAMPQNNTNEAVMASEISRLRDELSKTQNSQNLHIEIERLKEDMDREKRQNESQFLAEIKRLNERIEELEQPAQQSRSALSGNQTAGYLEPAQPSAPSPKEMNKLLGLNESLLRTIRDNDARLLSDLSELKKSLESMPGSESLNTTIEEIRATIKSLQERPETIDYAETLKEISTAIADLRTVVDQNAVTLGESVQSVATGVDSVNLNVATVGELLATQQSATELPVATTPAENGASNIDSKLLNKLIRMKSESAKVDLTEVIRSVYELKGMLGAIDSNQRELVNMALKAYTELDLLHISFAHSPDFRTKLDSIEKFVTTINEQDFITVDALDAYNLVLEELLSTPLDRSVFDAVCSFASGTGKITVPNAKKEAVGRYLNFAERAKREDLASVVEFLPDLVAALNDADGSKHVAENASILDDAQAIAVELSTAGSETDRRNAETSLRSLIDELTDLRLGSVVTYAPVMPLPTSDALHFEVGDSVSDRIDMLMQTVGELRETVATLGDTPVGQPASDNDMVVTSVQSNADGVTADSVSTELSQLESMIAALDAKVNLDECVAAIDKSYQDIVRRLASIDGRLSAGAGVVTEGDGVTEEITTYAAPSDWTKDEVVASVQTSEENLSNTIAAQAADIVEQIGARLDAMGGDSNVQALEELAAIRDKLAEQDAFITQIGDLRADVLGLPELIGGTSTENGQFDKLYEDIVAQLDKLYDDLSAVQGDVGDKISAQIVELKDAVDALSLSDANTTVLDSLMDFRAAYDDNQALSAADRAQLLEDVAYVREQVQLRLEEQASQAVNNEELASMIGKLQSEFFDNMHALEDKIAALEVAETAVVSQYAENESGVSGQIEMLSASVDNIMSALDELKAKSTALEDAINTNGMLASDNQSTVEQDISRILQQLTADDGDESAKVYDQVIAISSRIEDVYAAYEQANSDVLAQLADIKEQVHLKELEQNLASVSATEEEQQTLLSEIASLRERLANLETEQLEQNAAVTQQLTAIVDQITALSTVLSAENDEALSGTVETIDAKLSNYIANDALVAANVDLLVGDITAIKELLSGDNAQNFSNQAFDDLNQLLSDVAEIKDKLNLSAEASSDFVKLQDDVTFIRNQIEATIESAPDDDTISASLESEGISMMMDDLATIKEKLTAMEEYDTISEILSLREDVKTMMENGDVLVELEGLKGDLSELKADISDLRSGNTESVIPGGDGTPTSDEVNMLLSEIVSLRDEIQAYKDDITNMVSTQDTHVPEVTTAVADENISVILDELTGLHSELVGLREENLTEQTDEINALKAGLTEIKDMISRRTTLVEDGTAHDSAASNELNVVLDEIVNVKDVVAALRADWESVREDAAAERESDAAAEKAVFADELQAFKTELYAMVSEKLEELSLLQQPDTGDDLQDIKQQLSDLQDMAVGGVVGTDDGEVRNALMHELSEIKAMIAQQPEQATGMSAISLDALYGEVLALRQDIETLQQPGSTATVGVEGDASVTDEVIALREEIAALREQMATAPVTTAAPDDVVLGEVIALRDELAAMREQMQNAPVATAAGGVDSAVLNEILTLRDEMAAMREQMQTIPSAAASEVESDTTLLNEVLGLRDELERMRQDRGVSEETAGLMEAMAGIHEDVRAIKEEPDLSIVSEVLALRDEFQAVKDELHNLQTAPREDKSKDDLVAEVQSLRDQLFAISMANVNDGTSSDVVYESYNNIILDEISALRDEIALIKQSDETSALAEELSQLKDRLTNMAIDDREKVETRFEEIREEIAQLKKGENEASNNAILDELATLKEELANQREADAVTQNFMSELARLLERRDASDANSTSDRLAQEIESLKAELVASLAAPAASTEDILDEIERLRGEVTRRNESNVGAAADNSVVLDALAAIRTQIDRINPSEDNRRILNEITRLKQELGTLAERGSDDDGALSRSISDLKAELNQLAGIMDEDETSQPVKSTATPVKKVTGAKRGPKPGTKRKTTPKADNASSDISGDRLISKINATSIASPDASDDALVLDPDFTPDAIPATSEEMDIAARIAKQVANKLIMEQLVQQLGDGSVPHSEVEEIVRDILPQEFTTIQVDEQSDKVRRLANSLVLDKLRSRLKK